MNYKNELLKLIIERDKLRLELLCYSKFHCLKRKRIKEKIYYKNLEIKKLNNLYSDMIMAKIIIDLTPKLLNLFFK